MNISFYNGTTGLMAQQDGMNIYSNNIANINTVGYKALRPSFADCVYTIQRETEQDWQTGHGAYVFKTDFLYDQGSFQTTEQPLDFALTNDGFFQVENRNGNRFLTRDGSFNISYNPDAEQWQLVNEAGEYVMGKDGGRIEVPFVVETDEDGNSVTTNNIDYAALKPLIGIFTVPNKFGLDQADTNHFAMTERSGMAVLAPDDYTFEQGYLEMSTVDLAAEMVHLIETQRAYQLNSKVISTSDEMMRIVNNLRS